MQLVETPCRLSCSECFYSFVAVPGDTPYYLDKDNLPQFICPVCASRGGLEEAIDECIFSGDFDRIDLMYRTRK